MTEYVTDVCDQCGNLRSVCSDPGVVAYPQRSVCYLTAATAQLYRRTQAKYGHPEPNDPRPHETDGLQWWASLYDLTPEDDFFREQSAVGLLDAARGEEAVSSERQAEHSE